MFKQGVKIIKVKNPQEGLDACKSLLYENVSKTSILFLSGGTTPKTLYENLVKEQKLKVGAVALIDERFGKKLHKDSNEKTISDTGLIQYLEKNARFYPVLENKDIHETARDYDETIRFLYNYFQKSVGILGIGADGHTAGLRVGMSDDQYQNSNKTEMVVSFEDFPGEYKKRITITFLALSKLDLIIVLAFGKEKKKALKLMFQNGSISEIPARFWLQKGIAEKTILVTDQKI